MFSKSQLTYYALLLFAVALPFSTALVGIATGILIAVWILTGDYSAKFNRLKENRLAIFIISITMLYFIAFFFANDFVLAFNDVKKSLSWLLFGLIIATIDPLTNKQAKQFLFIYCLAVIISASIAYIRLCIPDAFGILNFRKATLVEHIPFSYQLGFVICILVYTIFNKSLIKSKWVTQAALVMLILFLVYVLFAIKSITGYIYFLTAIFVGMVMFALKIKLLWKKLALSTVLISIVLVPLFYVIFQIYNFYTTPNFSSENIPQYTLSNHKYVHDFSKKDKENGNFTFLFICEEELRLAWNNQNIVQYDSLLATGWKCSNVLLRYMTSKGLSKDSVGFAQLTSEDIINITNGIPNYIYENYSRGIYPRIYETIWEVDQYLIYNEPNAKSLPQRIEQLKIAYSIIKENFWLGIGIGNTPEKFQEMVSKQNSKLEIDFINSAHNQYINYLFKFGFLGAFYILVVLFFVFVKKKGYLSILFTIFFISILTANFGEANWETYIGSNFYIFFLCLFLFVFPETNDFEKNNLLK